MKNINIKSFCIYIMILLYTIFVSILYIDNVVDKYNLIINPIFWLITFVLSIVLLQSEKIRIRKKTDKTQTIFIILLGYIICYFISGLIFGFSKSPYMHTIPALLKNSITYIVIIIFQEIVRYALLASSPKNRISYFFITLLFILVEINFYKFGSNFSSGEVGFKYVSKAIIPLISRNVLFTYLILNAGYGATIAFRLPLAFINVVAPIFPNLSWFVSTLFDLTLCFIIYIVIHYQISKMDTDLQKSETKKRSPLRNLPFIVLLFVIVGFVAGAFKYMPVAIMSNSMYSVINRGDLVVIKKLSDSEKDRLKIGEIIEYKLDKTVIVHRIVDIKRVDSNTYEYITKGDNNKDVDSKPVVKEQIVAKVKFKISYIGYPVVYLNEFFEKTKPDVSLGDK